MLNFKVCNYRFPYVVDDVVLYDSHHDEYFCLFTGLVLMSSGVLYVDSDDYFNIILD